MTRSPRVLRYFSGIKETNLVLKPAKPTTRDGVFSAAGLEPDSYLYAVPK